MNAPKHELTELVAKELKKATRDRFVVLTRHGKPVAYILPTAIYDEEDIGYMTDPEFWKMIQERRDETTIPLETVLAEMGIEPKPVKSNQKPAVDRPRKRRASA